MVQPGLGVFRAGSENADGNLVILKFTELDLPLKIAGFETEMVPTDELNRCRDNFIYFL